jgi:hypothetical protein
MKKPHKRQRITEITRQAIIDRLFMDSSEPFYGKSDLISFLKRTWPLSQMPSTDSRFKDAEGDIWQHSINNDDWSDSELLWNRLKIGEIPDEQFSRFLEARVHPLICPDRDRLESLVAAFNEELKNDRFVMRKASEISGRPIYKVVSMDHIEGMGNAYEVVLSFAGEDRVYVDQVAKILRERDIALFYDNYEEVTLWGKNLTEHLHKVYSSSLQQPVPETWLTPPQSREKPWPSHCLYERSFVRTSRLRPFHHRISNLLAAKGLVLRRWVSLSLLCSDEYTATVVFEILTFGLLRTTQEFSRPRPAASSAWIS